MTTKDKYYLGIEKKLSSGNEKEILDTIKDIRISGQARIIPLIIALLDHNKDNVISQEVLSLLGQLKDKAVIPYIIPELKSKHTNSYRTELIMTCWQSGLDYSHHIDVFTEAFIHGDYQASIESFSVIEEWIHNSPKSTIEICKSQLMDNLSSCNEEKKAFYLELIKLVESFL
jgi:hypothetical protein